MIRKNRVTRHIFPCLLFQQCFMPFRAGGGRRPLKGIPAGTARSTNLFFPNQKRVRQLMGWGINHCFPIVYVNNQITNGKCWVYHGNMPRKNLQQLLFKKAINRVYEQVLFHGRLRKGSLLTASKVRNNF